MSLSKLFGFLLLLATLSFQSCFDYEEVLFKGVENISIAERTEEKLRLKISVKVDNPNKFSIKIKKSTLDIYINDKYAGKTTLSDKIVLKKNKEDIYDIYMNTNPKELMKMAMGSLGGIFKGSVKIRLKGRVKGSVYGVAKGVDVDFEESLNLKDFL